MARAPDRRSLRCCGAALGVRGRAASRAESLLAAAGSLLQVTLMPSGRGSFCCCCFFFHAGCVILQIFCSNLLPFSPSLSISPLSFLQTFFSCLFPPLRGNAVMACHVRVVLLFMRLSALSLHVVMSGGRPLISFDSLYGPHRRRRRRRSQGAFERRAASLRQRLSEPRARREAVAGLVAALDDAEAAAARGRAQLEEARDALSASQRRQGDSEVCVGVCVYVGGGSACLWRALVWRPSRA